MADNPNAFKHALSPATVRHIGGLIAQVEPSFDKAKFVKVACRGLGDLELKARVNHVIAALKAYLPENPKKAVACLVRVAKIWTREPGASETMSFAAWPIIDFVGVHGLEDFDASMQALKKLTPLFSAEFAVQPFIIKDPARAVTLMAAWRDDKNEHVRRLVSEGTRSRLPWGQRLPMFVDDPAPVLDLLEGLKDDPAEYVRRSVANNLNDIAKDHPDLVVKTCLRWAKGASEERQWVIKRATRTLVKDGHPQALQLLGFDPKAKLQLSGLAVSVDEVQVGDSLAFSFELRSRAATAQPLVVDYAVHHVKKSGERSAKVFKLKTVDLQPKASLRFDKKHSFKPISTRVYYPGRHAIEILVNGRSRAMVEFELKV